MMGGWSISCKTVLKWTPQKVTDKKSVLSRVMAWSRSSVIHYITWVNIDQDLRRQMASQGHIKSICSVETRFIKKKKKVI